MRASVGPGIEFLEYFTPRDGRSLPLDARSNDVLTWQTTLIVEDVDAIAQRLQTSGYGLVSSGIVTLPDRSLGFSQGVLVRDPDNHAVRLVER